MFVQFSQHIITNFTDLKSKNLLLAISGGLDSVVLAHLLIKLDCNVTLAHCNFQLRGEASEQDEAFVNTLAKSLKTPFFIKKFDTEKFAKQEKLSIQLAARQLRYDWFNTLEKEHNFDYILTAHHADDSLETFIINLSRGTGLDGLTGIPEKNDKLLRPLLPFTRKEIEHYAKTHNLTWREDASNAETKYLRNKIRHQIIPILKEINPNFLEAFLKTTQHLKESRQLIDETVVNAKEKIVITTKNKEIQLKMDELKKLKHPKVYLYEILKEYGFTAWKDVANLLEAQSGKEVFSKTHRLLKNRGVLIVSKNLSDKENLEFIIGKNMTVIEANNIKLRISELKDNHVISHLNTIFIDKSKLIWPLVLRKWKTGDYFYPLGMQGKKKVSKYFKDEKFSLLQKETTWLLCSDDKIIWIVNHRLDDRFKVTKNTKTILKIENTHSYSLPEASEEKD